MIDIANKKSLEIWTLNSAGATAKKFQRESRLDCYGVIEFKTMEAIKFHLYKVPMHINHSEPSFLLVMLLNSDKQKNKIRSSMNFSEFVPS